jgi:hypothetical protein
MAPWASVHGRSRKILRPVAMRAADRLRVGAVVFADLRRSADKSLRWTARACRSAAWSCLPFRWLETHFERPVDMQRSAAAPLGPVSPSERQQDRRPATLQQAEPRALSACGYSPARGFGCNVRRAENVPAAARPSRGEHPTARWARATQRRAGCL